MLEQKGALAVVVRHLRNAPFKGHCAVILICPGVSTATATKVSTIAARTKSLTVFVCASSVCLQ